MLINISSLVIGELSTVAESHLEAHDRRFFGNYEDDESISQRDIREVSRSLSS